MAPHFILFHSYFCETSRWTFCGINLDGRRGGAGGVRNDRMVYIANIPYDVRWMELKDLVREKAGEV